jgi:hypothetical protein
MKIVELIRLEESAQYGTFGVLKVNKEVVCVTLEPPDLLNRLGRSSIPAQQYICKQFQSPRYGFTYQIDNVPGRTYILFHSGNKVEDTEGCILLAQHFGKLQGDRAVLNSGATFDRFLAVMGGRPFHLTIREVY